MEESESGDVKITLKSGHVIQAKSFEDIHELWIPAGDYKIYWGSGVLIDDGKIINHKDISKITASVKKTEEITIWPKTTTSIKTLSRKVKKTDLEATVKDDTEWEGMEDGTSIA